MDGLLVIDKPAGMTSHDVVATVRHATGWTKVGHTGTLDPMATGVMPLLAGRATRLARFLRSDKVYEAEIRLGWATDTYDCEGTRIEIATGPEAGPQQLVAPLPPSAWPTGAGLQSILDRFRGTYMQAPPAYSAKMIGGTRAYTLARNGRAVEPRPSSVTVHDLSVTSCDGEYLKVRICCSTGFYVRSFAHELGLAVGPGAHLSALRRTRSGDFDISAAVPLTVLKNGVDPLLAAVVPLSELLSSLPSVIVSAQGAVRTTHGNDIRPVDCVSAMPSTPEAAVRIVDTSGALLAVATMAADGSALHPAVVVV